MEYLHIYKSYGLASNTFFDQNSKANNFPNTLPLGRRTVDDIEVDESIPIVAYMSETVCRPNGHVIGEMLLSKSPFRCPKLLIDRTNGYWDICQKPFSLHSFLDIENGQTNKKVKQDWICHFLQFYSYKKVVNRNYVALIMYLQGLKKLSQLAQYTIR